MSNKPLLRVVFFSHDLMGLIRCISGCWPNGNHLRPPKKWFWPQKKHNENPWNPMDLGISVFFRSNTLMDADWQHQRFRREGIWGSRQACDHHQEDHMQQWTVFLERPANVKNRHENFRCQKMVNVGKTCPFFGHLFIMLRIFETNDYTSIFIQEFFGCLFEGVEKCRNSQESRYLSWEMDHWTMDIKSWFLAETTRHFWHLGDFSSHKLVIFVCLMLIYAHHSSPSWPSANLSDIHHHPRTQVLQKLPIFHSHLPKELLSIIETFVVNDLVGSKNIQVW